MVVSKREGGTIVEERKSNYDEKYEEEYNKHWDMVLDALNKEETDEFRDEFLKLHPYDQSLFFIAQTQENRMRIYSYLSPDELAEFLINIELEHAPSYFTEMNPKQGAMILSKMPADDAVDILNEMDKEKVVSFLTMMDQDAADEIKQLLHYEEKTAGSIMTTEYVAILKSKTSAEAMQQLKKEAPEAETIYYLYVLDDDKKIVGVLSLRDLIVANDQTKIEDVMSEKVVKVSVAKDQEEIAQMFRDYDLLALPVVDFQDHLLGIITVDDILDVMEEEATEDYSKFAGISEADSSNDSPFRAAKKRLPWLIILLFLGMFTASLIGQFEETLDQVAVLAIFIPLIAGMAGNTGTQALAVAIRSLSTGDYASQGKMNLLGRELLTGLITGTVCGIVITIVIFFWQDDIILGIIVGVSIMASLIVATLAGSLVPILMDRLNIDPAVASGPFITTINDIFSILIYFGMATSFMHYLL